MQTSTHKPTVSVIMATRNRASMLVDAIESIRKQTLTDWQLIITDDGNSDETPAVLHDYSQKDQRIQYHRLDKHQGVSAARNVAIQHAQGTYIALQDDDDISLPTRLAEQIAFLQKHQHIDLVGCMTALFIGNNKDAIYPDSAFDRNASSYVETLAPVTERGPYPIVCVGTLMGKTDVFQKIPYRLFFQTYEDCDVLMRCLEHYNIETIPKVLYHYRQGGDYDKQTGPKNQHLNTEYLCLIWISAFHRFMGWQDPIDKAKTIDDVFHHIHPDFQQKASRKINWLIKDLIIGRTCHIIGMINTEQLNHLQTFAYKITREADAKRFRIQMLMKCFDKHPNKKEHILKIKRAFYQRNAMFILDVLNICWERRQWDLIKPALKIAIRSR